MRPNPLIYTQSETTSIPDPFLWKSPPSPRDLNLYLDFKRLVIFKFNYRSRVKVDNIYTLQPNYSESCQLTDKSGKCSYHLYVKEPLISMIQS